MAGRLAPSSLAPTTKLVGEGSLDQYESSLVDHPSAPRLRHALSHPRPDALASLHRDSTDPAPPTTLNNAMEYRCVLKLLSSYWPSLFHNWRMLLLEINM